MAEDRSPTLPCREQDLADKVAVVTGASKGIGRATALNLASRGCSILGTCSTNDSIQLIDAVAHEIKARYRADRRTNHAPKIVGIAADIFSPDSHITIANAVEQHFGHLNVIVLNAGAPGGGRIGSLEVDKIQHSCLGGIQAPAMTIDELVKRKLFRKDSRIVYISSMRSKKPSPGACVQDLHLVQPDPH